MQQFFKFTRVSSNAKTGHIPVTMSESATCPDTCPLALGGCYAKTSYVGMQWRQLDNGKHSISWDELCNQVSILPKRQIWRHNIAGDLPHKNGSVDWKMLDQLIKANNGRRGFTYTHHDVMKPGNMLTINYANKSGFAINLSANNPEHADMLLVLGIAPVVTMLPEDSPKSLKTPAGNTVVTCPATYRDDVQCANCGNGDALCARIDREFIIGFPVHGVTKKKAQRVIEIFKAGS